jgi:STE24 endopeptidase
MAGARTWVAAMAGWVAFLPMSARAASFDVDRATALYLTTLSPAARARSDAYFDGGLWLNAVSTLVTVLVCWLILRVGLLVRLRDALRRQGWRPWVVMLTVAATFLLALTLLQLPWSIYTDFWRERRFGLMNLTFAGWLGEQGTALLLLVVAGGLGLTVINAVIRTFPRTWWLVGAGVVGMMAAFFSLITPVFIMPLFNTYGELAPGPLRDRIVAMADANHIPTNHIYVFDASRQSDRISANVSGVGPTVQISLTDNLVKRASLPTAAAVVGHEMGHYVLGHVWSAIAFTTLLSALEFWLLARWGPAIIAIGAWRRGVRGLDDPAALPVLVGVMTVLSLLFLPLSNSFVRHDEAAADAFGLDTAREPDGFALAAMQLSTYRKISPPWWEELLFYDHPSGHTRVHGAMQWKKDHVPGASEVTPPPLPDPKGHP